MQIAMEKGIIDICLMNLLFSGNHNRKQSSDYDHFHEMSKCFIVMQALNLWIV